MQEATPEHVLAKPGARNAAPEPVGDPSGVHARFFREADALKVEAEGPEGKREV